MIKTSDLIYEFELKLNSLDRQDNQNIFLENKLIHLNNAQIAWIKSKLNQNNVFKTGYEGIRKRIDDLQVLKVNNKLLKLSKGGNQRYHNFYGDLTPVTDYMFYLSCFAKAKYKTCSDTIGVNLVKEGELEVLYYDENNSPSYKWRETLATLGDNKIYVYTDNKFEISEIRLTYLRTPKQMDQEGYVKPDGSQSINQDCELPEYAKNDILDLAVKYAAQATDNMIQTQFAIERENKNE